MFKNFLRFLGFEDEDENREYDDYSRGKRSRRHSGRDNRHNVYDDDFGDERYVREPPPSRIGLVLFKGLPSLKDKDKLKKALADGCIILLDLSEIPPDKVAEGNQFIQFMHGLSFASNGEFDRLVKNLFFFTPWPGMVRVMRGENTDKQGDEV